MGSGTEDCMSLLGTAGACAMAIVSLLSLLNLAFTASVIRGLAESAALLVIGLCCLQGEARLVYGWQQAVQENFGFALKPMGRCGAYFLGGFYCIGSRAAMAAETASKGQERSTCFGLLWYTCCFLMLGGSVASLWMWRGERRTAAMMGGGEGMADLDAYYISS
mmetsp:Transcript_30003/g.79067  ORF Transcript_30003/g.79067 Transcript_30003/m.79067 type:complete len:164 (-) Transcript_30003:74-565(-)